MWKGIYKPDATFVRYFWQWFQSHSKQNWSGTVKIRITQACSQKFLNLNLTQSSMAAKEQLTYVVCASALQLGRVIRIIWVNRVTFCPGQLGLTRFIKYPGLTWIQHRITCDIIMTSHGDDVLDNVSISCQCVSKRVIVDGVEAPRKVTRVWQQPWQSYVARPYDAPGAYQCSIVAVLIIGALISTGRIIWLEYARLYKGVALQYIPYSELRLWSKWKSTVNSKCSPQSTVKPLYLFDVINYTVKGQANFKQKHPQL